jgi:hypothetical protein
MMTAFSGVNSAHDGKQPHHDGAKRLADAMAGAGAQTICCTVTVILTVRGDARLGQAGALGELLVRCATLEACHIGVLALVWQRMHWSGAARCMACPGTHRRADVAASGPY